MPDSAHKQPSPAPHLSPTAMPTGVMALGSRHAGIFIFGISLLINFIVLANYRSSPFFFSPQWDAKLFGEWAQRIASGDIFGAGMFHKPPLYPYVLALIIRVFGANLLIVCAIQSILSALSSLLVYLICRRIANIKIALIAGLTWAFYDQQVFYTLKILSEALSIFLLLVFLWAMTTPRKWGWQALAGGAWGALCLSKPYFLLLAPIGFIIPVIHARRKGWKEGGALLVAFWLPAIVIVGAVTVRNYAAGKEYVLISYNSGENLYFGNSEGATGMFINAPGLSGQIQTQFEEFARRAELASHKSLTPSQVSRYWTLQTLRYIFDHPRAFLKLELRKLGLIFSGHEASSMYFLGFERKTLTSALHIPFINYFLVLPFFIAGIYSGVPWRDYWMVVAVFLVNILTMLIFWYDTRFMIFTMPSMVIIAAHGLSAITERVAASGFPNALRSRLFLVLIGSSVAAGGLFLIDSSETPVTDWQMHRVVGDISIERGDVRKAAESYSKIQELTKDDSVAMMGMSKVWQLKGRMDIAASLYTTAYSHLSPNRKYQALRDPQLDQIRAYLATHPPLPLDRILPP